MAAIVDLSLHKKQMEVYSSQHRFKVVVAGRRWGKTALSRTMILRAAVKPRARVWYIAPTFRMAKQIMWDEMLDAIPKKWISKVNHSSLTVTLKNRTEVALKGADRPDTLRGVALDFVVLDEFQDMKADVWVKVIRPTLSSTGGKAMVIGCVNRRTKVLPRTGAIEIGSLSKGSPDKTLDPINLDLYGLNSEFHNADGFWNNGVVKTKRIKTKMGFEIEASLPHPMWVMSEDGQQGWKKTEEIESGDRIAIARGMEVWGGKDPMSGWKSHRQEWIKQFDGNVGPKIKEIMSYE